MSADQKERKTRKPHRQIKKPRCEECNQLLPRKPYKRLPHGSFEVWYFKCCNKDCGASNNFDVS